MTPTPALYPLLTAPTPPLLLAARVPSRLPLPPKLLISPYPYFGGKAKVAGAIWDRIGDVPNFIDPFFGGGSILLKRPPEHPFRDRIETINDKDGMVSNFWRAIQADPDAVARYADWPVNENDLHARHIWLVKQKFETDFIARLEGDPDYFDPKIAGWWVWGMAVWIGSGFCSGNGSWGVVDGKLVKTEAPEAGGISRQLIHLADKGQGINRDAAIAEQSPRVSGSQGIHRKLPSTGDASPGVARQLLHLGDAGRRVQRKMVELGHQWSSGHGIMAKRAMDLDAYFDVLSARLKRVRVCSGDWSRVLGESPTTKLGITGVVLDPPYTHDGRNSTLYNHDSASIAEQVRKWAVDNGNNPMLRIAYCGYEDEFPWPEGWSSLKWTPRGGFDGQRKNGSNDNRQREIVWFSPHCLQPKPIAAQMSLFAQGDDHA